MNKNKQISKFVNLFLFLFVCVPIFSKNNVMNDSELIDIQVFEKKFDLSDFLDLNNNDTDQVKEEEDKSDASADWEVETITGATTDLSDLVGDLPPETPGKPGENFDILPPETPGKPGCGILPPETPGKPGHHVGILPPETPGKPGELFEPITQD